MNNELALNISSLTSCVRICSVLFETAAQQTLQSARVVRTWRGEAMR